MIIVEQKMNLIRRTFIVSILCGALPVYAQNTAKKAQEIRLNEEAIRMIQFDFSGTEMPREEMKAASLDMPWMKFKQDLRIPRSLTDTTRVKKPTGYVRMLPYTIWTRFGEDPVYDVLVMGRPETLEMHWTLNPNAVYTEEYGRNLPAGTGMMLERAAGRAGGNMGAGGVVGGLDFIGFVYNNLTPRGRMLKHNRKHANAWKIYKDYQPTREDSLKFPTYYRLLPVYAPTDTDTTAQHITQDSLLQRPMDTTLPSAPDEDRFYKLIRQRQVLQTYPPTPSGRFHPPPRVFPQRQIAWECLRHRKTNPADERRFIEQLFFKHKIDRQNETNEGGKVVPFQLHLKRNHRKDGEDGKRNHFLNHLELHDIERTATVFKP